MIFQKRKKNLTKGVPPITAKELADLSYADNFELPREEEKLRAVYEHERAGGSFDIRKVFSSGRFKGRTIATVANFPSDLVDMVEEQYGGGTYNIHPAGGPRVFKTYVIDGPSKYRLPGAQREKTTAQKLKEQFEEQAFSYALERLEEDPEMQRLVGIAALKKHLGIELPPETDWKERLVREGVEGNPEYRDAFVKSRLREEGAEFPEEIDPIEKQIEKYEQLERFRESLGVGQKQTSLLRELVLALPEVLKIVQQMQGSSAVLSDAQTVPALEAPTTQDAAPQPSEPATPSTQDAVSQPPAKADHIERQEGRIYGLGQGSPEVASPPEGLDSGPVGTPHPPTHPDPDTQPRDDTTDKPHISYVDWAELETGVHGDPGEFVHGVYLSAYEEHSPYHHLLARLFQDYEPDAILGELARLAESLAVDSGEEYEVAVLVLKRLAESEEGRLWLAKAHLASKVIQGKLQEYATGWVEPTENAETDGNDLDDEDFGGPVLV